MWACGEGFAKGLTLMQLAFNDEHCAVDYKVPLKRGGNVEIRNGRCFASRASVDGGVAGAGLSAVAQPAESRRYELSERLIDDSLTLFRWERNEMEQFPDSASYRERVRQAMLNDDEDAMDKALDYYCLEIMRSRALTEDGKIREIRDSHKFLHEMFNVWMRIARAVRRITTHLPLRNWADSPSAARIWRLGLLQFSQTRQGTLTICDAYTLSIT